MKKLALTRETVRILDDLSLDNVGGGRKYDPPTVVGCIPSTVSVTCDDCPSGMPACAGKPDA